MSLLGKIDKARIPEHITIIMDGNGRWAKARGLERVEGHKQGITALREVVEAASKVSVKYLTVYAFSTENWDRPSEEVDALMELIVYAVAKETPSLIENGVRVASIGDLSRLPVKTRQSLQDCMDKTAPGNGLTLVLALSYSSRWELTEAARAIARDVKNGLLSQESITEKQLSRYLTTYTLPDPDLLIRTGGEKRISNFLLWQLAYSELYFTDTFWPDFGEEELYAAIFDYQQRERRFGKTSEQVKSK
ncbi:isoprenyl transferase [Limibacterium fermenti]|uniref:isoprenyl transferase n=1 Tax=Limibacterium fermenti TaxID=3229863 RepID=UPI000E911201|nr:isoprenyl transferase [Porphyromonadaceae bacterium]